jgi:arylsulfatase A
MLSHSIRLIAACLSLLAIPAQGADSKPNIVVVLFDDLGWAQPPCYARDSALRTPHLDKLAAAGMRFTDAHSAAAVCTPTRYGLLTGRYPWRIGQFGVLTTFSKPIIPATRTTVASLLKENGYATACVGKWHLGLNWKDGTPGTQSKVPVGSQVSDGPKALGFDDFYGFTHARNIGSIIGNDRVVASVEPSENQPMMIRKAVEWIDERAKIDKPFFLYFPMCPPHTPIVPTQDFLGKSGARDLVRNDPKYGDWLYQGDAMLGELVAAIERNKLAENTLIIATSDNGAEGRAYAPLRGSKRSVYEGGHRVPFVARWPGKIKPGRVNDQTICLNDLMATAAEIAGAKIPADAGEDSVSQLSALLGTAPAPAREATVHQSFNGDLAIRQGPWKMIFHKSGRRELFNIEQDFGESKDVLSDHSDTATKLTDLMRGYIVRGRSTPGPVQKNEFDVTLDGKAKNK